MSVEAIERLLERVTYKPGWTIRLVRDGGDARLVIRFSAPDSTARHHEVPCEECDGRGRRLNWGFDFDFRPASLEGLCNRCAGRGRRWIGPMIEIQSVTPLPGLELLAEDWDEKTWLRWLFDQLRAAEDHEAAEFFKVDGVAPYDPHRAS